MKRATKPQRDVLGVMLALGRPVTTLELQSRFIDDVEPLPYGSLTSRLHLLRKKGMVESDERVPVQSGRSASGRFEKGAGVVDAGRPMRWSVTRAGRDEMLRDPV